MQLILRHMVVEASVDLGSPMLNAMRDVLHSDTHPLAADVTIALTTLPILLVYPFLQRYFTKGIMLGAIKA